MIDYKTLTDAELINLNKKIDEELERRRNRRREELWLEVRKSLDNYIQEFGAISVEDTNEGEVICLVPSSKFSEIGTLYA